MRVWTCATHVINFKNIFVQTIKKYPFPPLFYLRHSLSSFFSLPLLSFHFSLSSTLHYVNQPKSHTSPQLLKIAPIRVFHFLRIEMMSSLFLSPISTKGIKVKRKKRQRESPKSRRWSEMKKIEEKSVF